MSVPRATIRYRDLIHAADLFAEETRPRGPSRVLIVDDDTEVRDILCQGLQLAGFDVVVAASGAEGLQKLRGDPLIRLVLLDLMMPEMDGWRFRHEQLAHTRLASIPTVIMTGAALADVVDEHLQAQDYLLKPIGLEHLISVVANYVEPVTADEHRAEPVTTG